YSSSLFPYTTLFRSIQKLSSASIPFISFVYMTRVVQALTNQQSDEVVSLVIHYLVIFGILQLLSSLITPYVEQESDLVHHEIIRSEEHTSELQSRFD